MKDSKLILLGLLSVGLTGTWVYHLYDKSHYTHHQMEILVKDSLATQEAIKDSLQKLFNEKTQELSSTKVQSDSLQGQLGTTLSEIYRLKNEITVILKNKTSTREDLIRARDLIRQYKEKIEEIRSENSDLEAERERLNGILTQLNDQMKSLQDNMEKVTKENKQLTETINQASTFIASEIQLSAVTIKPGNKEVEATSAKKANKFVFSFTLQNNVVKTSYYDAYVVITDPNNKVLQNDVWGGNYFTTKKEGTKLCTMKIRFEFNEGQPSKVIYTLEPDKFYPGTYRMQIYQNGVMIGETFKTLS